MSMFQNTVTELWITFLQAISKIYARDARTDNDDVEFWHFFVCSHPSLWRALLVLTTCIAVCDPGLQEVNTRLLKPPESRSLISFIRFLLIHPTVKLSYGFSEPRSRNDNLERATRSHKPRFEGGIVPQDYHRRTSCMNREHPWREREI